MIGSDRGAPVTMWLIGDLDTSDAQKIALDALAHLQVNITRGTPLIPKTIQCATRLGFIHIPSVRSSHNSGYRLSTLIYQLLSRSALSSTSPAELFSLIEDLGSKTDNLDKDGWIEKESIDEIAAEGSPLHSYSSSGWTASDTAAAARFWSVGSSIASKLDLHSDLPHLLVNGRVSAKTIAMWSKAD
jgi:UDP-glucose:glycoprotein glucosyltransferase